MWKDMVILLLFFNYFLVLEMLENVRTLVGNSLIVYRMKTETTDSALTSRILLQLVLRKILKHQTI